MIDLVISGFVFDNIMNSSYRTIKQLGKAWLSPFTSGVQVAHCLNMFVRKAIVMMCFSKNWITEVCVFCAFRLSAFSYFVSHIISRCSQKQMFWITTCSIITGMTNKHPFGYRSVSDLKSISVCINRFSVFYRKPAISIMVKIFSIRPTFIWVRSFINIIPKSFNRVLLFPWPCVPMYIFQPVSLTVSCMTISFFCNTCYLSASAMTKTIKSPYHKVHLVFASKIVGVF